MSTPLFASNSIEPLPEDVRAAMDRLLYLEILMLRGSAAQDFAEGGREKRRRATECIETAERLQRGLDWLRA